MVVGSCGGGYSDDDDRSWLFCRCVGGCGISVSVTSGD